MARREFGSAEAALTFGAHDLAALAEAVARLGDPPLPDPTRPDAILERCTTPAEFSDNCPPATALQIG
jgi:hypothetical protein